MTTESSSSAPGLAERKAARGLPGRDRLWDSEWVNIVNHERCYEDFTKEEAVHLAVKLTEAKMAEHLRAALSGGAEGMVLDEETLLDAAHILLSCGGPGWEHVREDAAHAIAQRLIAAAEAPAAPLSGLDGGEGKGS